VLKWDEDLVVWYLMSHRGPEPMDQWLAPSEDIGRSGEEISIRKYLPAQQMEHFYHMEQEESILPTQYLPWREVFEQKASERFPGKCPCVGTPISPKGDYNPQALSHNRDCHIPIQPPRPRDRP
jgi:hypothetical protein